MPSDIKHGVFGEVLAKESTKEVESRRNRGRAARSSGGKADRDGRAAAELSDVPFDPLHKDQPEAAAGQSPGRVRLR